MGRVQVDCAVRYVSPVTARLFAKMGSEALGISSGEVLAPMASMSRGASGWRHVSQGQQSEGKAQDPPVDSKGQSKQRTGGGVGVRERRVEVVRPCSTPLVNGVTCPQRYLESILQERGYDYTTRSSASAGCRCQPTQKQIYDYQVPLVEAVRRWDMQALGDLAAKGVDMGAANKFGESVVHLATRRGSAPVLKFLLAHGGSLHICDDYGKTPLHDAFWTGEPRFDLVSMMLERDWRLLRAADVRGATPLRYAKKRHWGLWCEFLDRFKDKHWPYQNGKDGKEERDVQERKGEQGGEHEGGGRRSELLCGSDNGGSPTASSQHTPTNDQGGGGVDGA